MAAYFPYGFGDTPCSTVVASIIVAVSAKLYDTANTLKHSVTNVPICITTYAQASLITVVAMTAEANFNSLT